MEEGQIKFIATGIVVFIGLYVFYERKKSKTPRVVGKVAELALFPLKSCRGISVKTAEATELGLKCGKLVDRFFSARLEHNDDKMSGLQFPKMLLVEVEIGTAADTYIFKAPEMPALTLDISTLSQKAKTDVYGTTVDCIDGGDLAADWISKYIGKRSRISLQPTNRDVKVSNPGFDQIAWRLGGIQNFKNLVNFSNRYPYNILGLDSVRDINERIPGKTFTHRYFRPNIVVQATNKKPWDEDTWLGELHIGDAIFAVAAQKIRCPFTTMDPDTGIKDPDNEPMRTLKTFRLPSKKDCEFLPTHQHVKPCVAMEMLLLKSGTISVGDDIILHPN